MIRVGTRTSRLARAQTSEVVDGLEATGEQAKVVPLDTLGDREETTPVHELGVAGAFTAGLEASLADCEIDLAVHSLKDLPVEQPPGLEVAAVLERGPPQDVILVAESARDESREPPVAEGARVATSGPRRQSQLLAARPDLAIANVRGNVDTRVSKLREGRFDALVTARVALERMSLDTGDPVVHDLAPEVFPPAPGQAAIAVQAREGSPAAQAAASLDDEATRGAVEAERRVLDRLGGGCGLPLGAWVRPAGDGWRLDATFAGHEWTTASRPELRRVDRQGVDPEALADACAKVLETVEARPRRPSLDEVPQASGEPGLVVASEPTAKAWAALLREAGHSAVPVPTQAVAAVDAGDEVRERLDRADWVAVTSRNAAGPLAGAARGEPLDAYVAAVGPSTARALQDAGLPAHVIAPEATGASLAAEVARLADGGARLLLAQGDTVHGDVRDRLAEAGVTVDTWEAYRTRPIPVDPALDGLDLPAPFALVMSPRNARALQDAHPKPVAGRYLAIGPSTADALTEAGIDAQAASAPTPEAVLELIE